MTMRLSAHQRAQLMLMTCGTPWCLRVATRVALRRRGYVRDDRMCAEHGTPMVSITDAGRRAVGEANR